MAPTPRPVVTLTTDFGTGDVYVGQVKGAILAVCPDAIIVDLTHDIPVFDIEAGAFAIATSYAVFPSRTIHVVVVDPGVGTSRRGIVLRTAGHDFVAPDNGVLSAVLDRSGSSSAWGLEARHYRRDAIAPTFHGRDIFAPAAGWLARGIDPSSFGAPAESLVRLRNSRPVLVPGASSAVRVAHVDRFGNVVLDLTRRDVAAWCDAATGKFRGSVLAGGIAITTAHSTYGDAAHGDPFLLFGSFDRLEIAVRDGSAAGLLRLARGSEVLVIPGVL